MYIDPYYFVFFFLNDPAPTEIYPLSLHDALPIFTSAPPSLAFLQPVGDKIFAFKIDPAKQQPFVGINLERDRKSTRLNSSHQIISYAVFCLKKKKSRTETEPLSRTDRLLERFHPN